MQVDILVVNNTEIPLALDLDQDCQRDCHHKGWQVTISRSQLPQVNKEILQVAAGKIVEGREPPERVRFIWFNRLIILFGMFTSAEDAAEIKHTVIKNNV